MQDADCDGLHDVPDFGVEVRVEEVEVRLRVAEGLRE